MYAAMTPLLRHIGYGMTWQHCMACVWGGLRGPLSLCLALIVLQTPTVSDAGEVSLNRRVKMDKGEKKSELSSFRSKKK